MNMITACIDGSSISASVCDAAGWAANALNVPVKLLHIIEKTSIPLNENLSGSIGLGSREHLLAEMTRLDEERSRVALEHGRYMLEDARLRLAEQGIEDVFIKQRHGHLLESLLDCEQETSVFVMGRKGEDHDHEVHAIGSHVENIVRAVKTPVLVTVREFTPPQNYMIAYDGSPMADHVIVKFASSNLLKSLPAHLVMVAADNEANRHQLDQARQVLESAGRQVEMHLLQGGVQEVLSQFRKTHKIDFIVMGAYGHSRLREFFVGSQTSKMISNSPVPLLLLR